MYKLCKFIENVVMFLRTKLRVFYWKLKYGKRIKIGKNFRFRKGMIINIAENGYFEIGDNNFFNNYCSINCHNSIKIGNNNMFGENVKMYDHNHVFDNKKINMMITYKNGEIIIGNNNWITSDVTFLSKGAIRDYNVISPKTIINKAYNSENIIKNDNTTIKINYIGE